MPTVTRVKLDPIAADATYPPGDLVIAFPLEAKTKPRNDGIPEGHEIALLVSSVVLSLASPVFKAMLDKESGFKESIEEVELYKDAVVRGRMRELYEYFEIEEEDYDEYYDLDKDDGDGKASMEAGGNGKDKEEKEQDGITLRLVEEVRRLRARLATKGMEDNGHEGGDATNDPEVESLDAAIEQLLASARKSKGKGKEKISTQAKEANSGSSARGKNNSSRKEMKQLRDSRLVRHIYLEDDFQEETKIVMLFLHIHHGAGTRHSLIEHIPKQLSSDSLYEIAKFCDKYDINLRDYLFTAPSATAFNPNPFGRGDSQDTLAPVNWVATWGAQYTEKDYEKEPLKWLTIAWVFRDEELFEIVSKAVVRTCKLVIGADELMRVMLLARDGVALVEGVEVHVNWKVWEEIVAEFDALHSRIISSVTGNDWNAWPDVLLRLLGEQEHPSYDGLLKCFGSRVNSALEIMENILIERAKAVTDPGLLECLTRIENACNGAGFKGLDLNKILQEKAG